MKKYVKIKSVCVACMCLCAYVCVCYAIAKGAFSANLLQYICDFYFASEPPRYVAALMQFLFRRKNLKIKCAKMFFFRLRRLTCIPAASCQACESCQARLLLKSFVYLTDTYHFYARKVELIVYFKCNDNNLIISVL